MTDDGVGLDPEAVDRLRLHLGLDALRERVRLAGGQVAIQSTPGTGTCLRFQIPITRDRSSG